jgi:3-methyladenine DNA glycosylase AlkC
MRAQYELTKRLSAEWCVRPYIAKDPERAFAFFARWAKDRNSYVRRLVSEGTRLRLPWGTRVAWLDENPEQILLLLEMLKDDPAPMVRRSVANNLNDLGKKYPELLTRTCAAWLKSGSSAQPARSACPQECRQTGGGWCTVSPRCGRGAFDPGGAPSTLGETHSARREC